MQFFERGKFYRSAILKKKISQLFFVRPYFKVLNYFLLAIRRLRRLLARPPAVLFCITNFKLNFQTIIFSALLGAALASPIPDGPPPTDPPPPPTNPLLS